MGLWNLIVRFFQGGGDFMYPIAVVFVFGLAIGYMKSPPPWKNRTIKFQRPI